MNHGEIYTMDKLHESEYASVVALQHTGSTRKRLLEIGLVPGCRIKCVIDMSNNNMLAYQISGAVIAIRHTDARLVTVK